MACRANQLGSITSTPRETLDEGKVNASMLMEADLPEDIEALRAFALEGSRKLAELMAAKGEADAEIERLQSIIDAFMRRRFGPRSEQLDPEQLQLGLEDVETALGQARAEREAATGPARGERPRKTNRGSLPAHLERIEQVVDVDDKACPCCGGTLHQIGEDVAERLDVIPTTFRVLVTRRPRYGCRSCESAVVQAPARIVEGGIPTEALIAQVLVAKYADHLPLYRQAQIYARQGVQLDRSTLADWVGRAAWYLRPLRDHILERLRRSERLFADETTAPVLDPGRGRTKTGQLWAYARDDRLWGGNDLPMVAYVYAADRKSERAEAHLGDFAGILQVDGYGGYTALAKRRQQIQLAFCWSHVRRKFYELADKSPVATEVLRRIAQVLGGRKPGPQLLRGGITGHFALDAGRVVDLDNLMPVCRIGELQTQNFSIFACLLKPIGCMFAFRFCLNNRDREVGSITKNEVRPLLASTSRLTANEDNSAIGESALLVDSVRRTIPPGFHQLGDYFLAAGVRFCGHVGPQAHKKSYNLAACDPPDRSSPANGATLISPSRFRAWAMS